MLNFLKPFQKKKKKFDARILFIVLVFCVALAMGFRFDNTEEKWIKS